jgi:SpoVK/Ycf46/Vps4 family AAA+-type ATPase
MTTNRADEIDPAFHSRIHLTLHYPDLDPEAKKHIWTQFVTNSGHDHRLAEKDFEELCQLKMNGRQIKNVVKISLLLAARDSQPLEMEHIRTVLSATRAGVVS